MSKLVILSDIHANLSALKAVIADFQNKYKPEAIISLGDLINYGMRPNEVIEEMEQLSQHYPIVCNLCGNHERSILYPQEQLSRFSSERGKQMLEYTRQKLSFDSMNYLQMELEEAGQKKLQLDGRNILCIHGDLNDPYWGKLDAESVENENYAIYDYVFSGHTHLPHHMEILYKMDIPKMRNRKKTIFLNPGSVGQPRNQNPRAQYLYVDLTEEIFHHVSVEYDVVAEQSLYTNETDKFYKDRLFKGI